MLALLDQWNAQLAKHPRLAGGLLFLVAFAVYQKTLAGLFVFDDIPQIVENPFITNPHLWPRIFQGSVWSFRGPEEHDNFYRPLQFVVYWLLDRLAGPRPAVFHFFHLLFYAATVWLVFRLGRELLRNHLAACVGALLWALHPLHVEPVCWLSALPDVGSGYFYIWAFLLFLRAEKAENHRAARHGLAALAYFPALFFKEMALSFPLLLLAYGFFFPSDEPRARRAGRWALYLVPVAVYAIVRIVALGRLSEAPRFWQISWRMLAGAVGLLGQHAKLFFWPTHLSPYRTFELGASLRSPWPWLTLVALLAMCWLRRREPVFSFLVAWWAVTLVPCLDTRQIASLSVGDRFSYLPSVGLCLAGALAVLRWLPRRLPRLEPAAVVTPGLGVIMCLWAVQDLRVSPQWHDNVTTWNYSLRASPDSPLVHLFQGALLENRDANFDGAAREYEVALRLNQASFRPAPGITYDCYLGLGRIALHHGRLEEGIRYYDQAVRVAPSHSPAYRALGAAYFPRGDYAKAASYFVQAVKFNPQDVEARFFLGTCWLKLGKPREAAAQFHAAREVDPTYDQAFEAEARALEAAGDRAEAARVRSLKSKP